MSDDPDKKLYVLFAEGDKNLSGEDFQGFIYKQNDDPSENIILTREEDGTYTLHYGSLEHPHHNAHYGLQLEEAILKLDNYIYETDNVYVVPHGEQDYTKTAQKLDSSKHTKFIRRFADNNHAGPKSLTQKFSQATSSEFYAQKSINEFVEILDNIHNSQNGLLTQLDKVSDRVNAVIDHFSTVNKLPSDITFLLKSKLYDAQENGLSANEVNAVINGLEIEGFGSGREGLECFIKEQIEQNYKTPLNQVSHQYQIGSPFHGAG